MRLSLRRGFLYFFVFLLVGIPLNWFIFVSPMSRTIRAIDEAPKYFNENLVSQFPADLIVQVSNGQVVVNQPLPYCLPLNVPVEGVDLETVRTAPPGANPNYTPINTGILFVDEVDQEQLASLSPSTTTSSELCKPIAIITKNMFVTYDTNTQQPELQPIPKEIDVTITQDFIKKWIGENGPALMGMVKLAYFAMPFALVILAYLGLLILNFWYAAVTLVFYMLFKKSQRRKFADYYAASLYGQIAWQLIAWLINIIVAKVVLQSDFQLGVPFLGTVAILLFNMWLLKKNPPPEPEDGSPAAENEAETTTTNGDAGELAGLKANVVQAPPATPAPDLDELMKPAPANNVGSNVATANTRPTPPKPTVTIEAPPKI